MKYLPLLLCLGLAACQAEPATTAEVNEPATPAETAIDPAAITLGNGTLNFIETVGIMRQGPTLIVPSVLSETDAFLVLHPFADGKPVRTDYVASTFVAAGTSESVTIRLDDTPNPGTPFIIMLHTDVNVDGTFQFGDGITVPDAPVLEGTTLIALPMQVPISSIVTPEIIHASYREHADKAAAFMERADYRDNASEARIRALIHQYLYEVERPDRNGTKIEPLLADGFEINFPSGRLTTIDQLSNWVSGPASSFEATRHVLHNISYSDHEEGGTAISMEMEWDGLTSAGDRMSARTSHRWRVTRVDGADVPKISRVDVEILEPFTPADW